MIKKKRLIEGFHQAAWDRFLSQHGPWRADDLEGMMDQMEEDLKYLDIYEIKDGYFVLKEKSETKG